MCGRTCIPHRHPNVSAGKRTRAVGAKEMRITAKIEGSIRNTISKGATVILVIDRYSRSLESGSSGILRK